MLFRSTRTKNKENLWWECQDDIAVIFLGLIAGAAGIYDGQTVRELTMAGVFLPLFFSSLLLLGFSFFFLRFYLFVLGGGFLFFTLFTP